MTYAKLHGSILTSSVWAEPYHVRLVWIGILAVKDKDGLVVGTTKGLARVFGVTTEECEEALSVLSSPDPDSQSQAEEGRRIIREEIDGRMVWRVVNHEFYRNLESREEQKERTRIRVARHREKRRNAAVTDVTPSEQSKAEQSRAEDLELSSTSSPQAGKPAAPRAVLDVFEFWRTDTGRQRTKLDSKRKARIAARLREGFTVGDLCEAIRNRRNDRWLMGLDDSPRVYDGLETLLRDAAQVERLRDLKSPQRQKSKGSGPVQKDPEHNPFFDPMTAGS